MIPFVGPYPATDDWYSFRRYNPDSPVVVRFGASEAAAVCGVSEYSSRLQVYRYKRGLDPAQEETDDMWMGRAIESLILDLTVRRHGYRLKRDCPCYVHPKFPWLIATPDAIVLDSDDNWLRPLDAKHSSWIRHRLHFGPEMTDEVPMDLLMQGHQQNLVLDTKEQEIVVFHDKKLSRYFVQRSKDVDEMIIENSRMLYGNVEAGIPPEPDFELEVDCDIIKEMNTPTTTGKSVTADEALESILRARADVAKQKSDAETLYKTLTAQALELIGDANIVQFEDGRSMTKTTVNVAQRTQVVEAYSYPLLGKLKQPKKEK